MSGRVFVKAYQTRKEALGSARAKAGALPQYAYKKAGTHGVCFV